MKNRGIVLVPVLAILLAALVFSCHQQENNPMNTVAPSGASLAKGNGLPAGAKRVFSFNLIGYPAGQTYTGDCGEGHRIFVNRDANHAHIVVVGGNTGWSVVDCNATDNNTASLQTDTTGTFEVFVRILGKPGGSVTVCADTLSDCILFGTCDAFCHLGTFTLNRVGGKSSFTIEPSSMFDASLFNIIWTVTTNSDYRIAQFVVVQLS